MSTPNTRGLYYAIAYDAKHQIVSCIEMRGRRRLRRFIRTQAGPITGARHHIYTATRARELYPGLGVMTA